MGGQERAEQVPRGPVCEESRKCALNCNPGGPLIPCRRVWTPVQCSCLENPMNRGAWRAIIVHGTAKESDRNEQLTL